MQVDHNNITSQLKGRHLHVCFGKEWYRYPSSFFLPDTKRYRMRFIRSEFRGQLPKLYDDNDGSANPGLRTRIIYKDFNDMNKEEMSRYVDAVRDCHYIIDSRQEQHSKLEPNYSANTRDWTVLSSHKMLDLVRSPAIIRSFYLPFFSEKRNRYVEYQLLRNNNLFSKTDNQRNPEIRV